MRDLTELAHCQLHHCAEILDAERLAADPEFPSVALWRELRTAYGPLPTMRLWRSAAAIYREAKRRAA